MTNSKVKGKRGELDFCHALQDLGFTRARRGQQYSGGQESADVDAIRGVHVEVKRVQRLNIVEAMDQAVRDCGTNVPIVAHRRNRTPWLITVRLEDLDKLCLLWQAEKSRIGTTPGD